MKKSSIMLAAALMAMAPVSGLQAADVTMHTPAGYQVLGISPNGKWACGVFVDASVNTYGFRWNLEGGGIELLGMSTSTAWDISDDGTVSGDFMDTEVAPNGAPVSMPGFWRDGDWHHLEMPEGRLGDGIGGGISPDGLAMVGAIQVNGIYTPYIWVDGKISRNLDTGKDAVAMAVSPDGRAAAGYSTRKNRTVCYWPAEGEHIFLDDANATPEAPWCYARNFSADGSKLLYWGGWHVEGEDEENQELWIYTTYDVATGERIKMKMPAMDDAVDLFDISNDGTIVGEMNDRGCVFENGTPMYVDDFLAAKGIDLSKFEDFYSAGDYYAGQLPIYRIVGITGDSKTMAMQYYNKIGELASLVLKMDCNPSEMPPAEIKGHQLQGLTTVGLEWKAPVGASGLRGYNVYRDGMKVSGFLPINRLYFYDKNLAAGSYDYVVGTVSANGVETKSEPVTVTVQDLEETVNAPRALLARQKGIGGAYLEWEEPLSNLVHLQYNDPEIVSLNSFGIYQPMEMEAAVRFDKNEMANYADSKITEVSFYPMGNQSDWKVNIYSMAADGSLTEVASQPVTQPLQLKRRNTVVLDNPVAIPTDGDLVVAVSVTTGGTDMEVLGTEIGRATPAYSDLLRVVGEPDYISAFESSLESALTLTVFSWAIDAGITPNGYDAAANTLSHYNVVCSNRDSTVVVNEHVEDNTYMMTGLEDGDYDVTVEAVYASGSVSQPVASKISVASVYPAISDVEVEKGDDPAEVKFVWKAPVDNDPSDFSYTTAKKHSNGIQGSEGSSYSMMAAIEFPATKMRGFDGYKVDSFRFYPLCDAIFTLILQENGNEIYAAEVTDYELGKWNEVKLNRDIYVSETSSYRYVVDVFNAEADKAVLGVDNQMPLEYLSDLYSTDNGNTWNSLNADASFAVNWLMGMTLVDPDAAPLAVEGYDVVVDGSKKGDKISGTEYAYRFEEADAASHDVRIDVYYPAGNAVMGDKTEFYLNSGIGSNVVADITLSQGDNVLVAEGEGVERVEIYSAGGAVVASAVGNRVEIDHLADGIYIVYVKAGEGSFSRKIRINK